LVELATEKRHRRRGLALWRQALWWRRYLAEEPEALRRPRRDSKLCLATGRACGHDLGEPAARGHAANPELEAGSMLFYYDIHIYIYMYIYMHIYAHTSLHAHRDEGDTQLSMFRTTFFA